MRRLILVLLICLFSFSNAHGGSVVEAGQAIANYAKYVQKHKIKDFTYYGPVMFGATAHRSSTYDGQKSFSRPVNGREMQFYATDCNGFVGFVVHYATNLGPSAGNDTISSFTVAGNLYGAWKVRKTWRPYFEELRSGIQGNQGLIELYRQGTLLPGDLIASIGDGNTHIQIYVGDGRIVDNTSPYPNALHVRSLSNIKHRNGVFTVFRITPHGAAAADLSKIVYPNGDGTLTDITCQVLGCTEKETKPGKDQAREKRPRRGHHRERQQTY